VWESSAIVKHLFPLIKQRKYQDVYPHFYPQLELAVNGHARTPKDTKSLKYRCLWRPDGRLWTPMDAHRRGGHGV
jgi:hypothetical protein